MTDYDEQRVMQQSGLDTLLQSFINIWFHSVVYILLDNDEICLSAPGVGYATAGRSAQMCRGAK